MLRRISKSHNHSVKIKARSAREVESRVHERIHRRVHTETNEPREGRYESTRALGRQKFEPAAHEGKIGTRIRG